MSDVLALAMDLVARQSVTPDDAGCQSLIAARLAKAGFSIEEIPFGPVLSLWASHGSGSPVLVFLGHTDVVPTGPVAGRGRPPRGPPNPPGHPFPRRGG